MRAPLPRCLVPILPLVWPLAAAAQLTLVDVAGQAGVDALTYGRGAAAVDLDEDGLIDLVACDAGGPNLFYRQLPDHTFELANAAWGVPSEARPSWAIVATDLDGDGDVDCFFGNGGFYSSDGNQVFRNDIPTSGLLVEMTASSSDAGVASHTFGTTGLDYDNDGDVDIYLSSVNDRNLLLRNDGDFEFTDVATAAGLGEQADYRHTGSGDFDNDGWVDIGVGRQLATNRLFRNLGDGTFADVAVASGLDYIGSMFGFVFEDFDNDGWLDVYLPNYTSPQEPDGDHVFLNDGDGTFRDATAGSGLTPATAMGHDTGDIDGDGYPDIYVGTGRPGGKMPDVLWLVEPDGQGGIAATDVSQSSGLVAIGPTRSHGSVFFDWQGDGDIDLFCSNGGPEGQPVMLEVDRLFRNDGPAKPFATLGLEGVLSNRGALHARAAAFTSTGRAVRRELTAGKGFGNTDSPVLHFGMQPGETIERIEVRWPSGVVQTDWWPQTNGHHALLETGLRTVDHGIPGIITTLDLCGAPSSTAYLLLGLDAAHIPMPGHGGVLEIFPLLAPLLPVPLGPQGRLSLPIPVATDPLIVGLELRVQALVDGAKQMLTNTVVVVIE